MTYKEWAAQDALNGPHCNGLCAIESNPTLPQPLTPMEDLLAIVVSVFFVILWIYALIKQRIETGTWSSANPDKMTDQEFEDWQEDKGW